MSRKCALPKHDRKAGYTLVELSIVIVIISLLTASGLAVGASMVERAAYTDTGKLLEQLKRSVQDYYIVNGRLPCAARMNILPGASTFGVEEPGCANIGTDQVWTSGSVHIGMVPVRTLGLPDTAASDKFGNRIFYAVTIGLTSTGTFASTNGSILIRGSTSSFIATDGAFFLASTGSDRKGGYLYNRGTKPKLCGSSANLDVENCNNNNAFRDAPFNNGEVEGTFFDDITAWSPKFHLTATNTQSSSLWAASGTNIYAVGTDGVISTGNVGIGISAPAAKLDVNGVVKVGLTEITSGAITMKNNADTTTAWMNGTDNPAGALWITSVEGFNGAMIALNGKDNASNPGMTRMISTNTLNNSTSTSHSWATYNGTYIYERGGIKGNGELHLSIGPYNGPMVRTCVMGSVTGSVTCSSDKRLKEDIRPLDNTLERLLDVKGVYFKWKNEKKENQPDSIGVLAQDVQKVFPEAVSEGEDGFLMVSMEALIPPIIEAIRELKDKNDALETRLAALESQAGNGASVENTPALTPTPAPDGKHSMLLIVLVAVLSSAITSLLMMRMCRRS